MLKRTLLLAFLIPLALLFPLSASAQGTTTRIATLQVSLWPEYDQPGVLVQYQGKLADADQKQLPRDVAFLVPQGVGVAAACAIQSDGQHTSETWKEADGGDGFTRVTYELSQPQFHVEFYYNPLGSSSDKTLEFAYKAALPVDELAFDVQHPLKATNFVLSPQENELHKDEQGFTYHTFNLKQVTAGQTVSTRVSYTKTDPSPSVSGDKTQTTEATAQSTEGINSNLIIVLSVVAAAFGMILFFALGRRTRLQYAPAQAAPSTARVSRGSFCTECGTAMDPEDVFCGNCGTKRKTV